MSELPLILIVDDNGRNRKLAADVLRSAHFRTIEAGTAADAIASAVAHQPDLILMDLRLPDLDGTEATRVLRLDHRLARVPVVALSALPLDGDDEWLSGAGFAGAIAKPLDIDTFPDQVRRFIASHRD